MNNEPFKLDHRTALTVAAKHGTPVYVYSLDYLRSRADGLAALCRQKDFLARYALKANPHPRIIRLFNELGLHFDASSEYEAKRLMDHDIEASKISLSSQQPPKNLAEILDSGVQFVATSIHQLDLVSKTGWQGNVGVRLNPGLGAGHNNRTTTGGAASSFGVWHEYIPEIMAWQKNSDCLINKIHVHIGSGGDPRIWRQTIERCLELVEAIPTAAILNIGGGYKVSRMPDEPAADMSDILESFAAALDSFKARTGREINLEIEPGTWLVANGGVLLAEIIDITDTGKQGFNFLKLNTGMNDFLRTAMYGAQHPILVFSDSTSQQEYVVVGHNCETGDILTPAAGNPEAVLPRRLNLASIGDLAAIGGTGAYSASMRAIGYNNFPPAKEIFV